MIVTPVIIALLLSQPVVKAEELDMHYKPCSDMYTIYLEIKAKDLVQGAIYGDNLRVICSPISYLYKE